MHHKYNNNLSYSNINNAYEVAIKALQFFKQDSYIKCYTATNEFYLIMIAAAHLRRTHHQCAVARSVQY